jgi:TRAP-type uncharacterized transport system substrate-binding protein
MPSSFPFRRPKLVTALIEMFGFSPLLAGFVAMLLITLGAAAVLWIVLSAPPRTITIASGPPGSLFERHAAAYQSALAARGITLNILPTNGSLDNLQRLQDPAAQIDLGFVQSGLMGSMDEPKIDLVSLGSIAYQPLWIFYRSDPRITRLSELAGKRIGIGAGGSGVKSVALEMLKANGVTEGPTTLVEQATVDAAKDFQAGKLDAIFLMGDSAPISTVRGLVRAPGIQVFNFTQADAYVRRLPALYLNKVVIPQGALDLGQNLPAQDLTLVGPSVELIAREGLNSALSDMVLDIAQKVHGRAGLFAQRDEFPAPLVHEFPLSDDAVRFYKSGKSLTYRLIGSFWVANLINRLLIVIVPLLLVLIPLIRILPVIYRWTVLLRIYRHYRPLLQLEREIGPSLTPEAAHGLLPRLDAIEQEVNALRLPVSFSGQFYDLRYHVAFVRRRLRALAFPDEVQPKAVVKGG